MSYAAVKQHFADLRFSSAGVCAEMTGLALDAVCVEMRRLMAEGRIRPVDGVADLYCYGSNIEKKEPAPQAGPAERKLWWAMTMPHNNPAPFTTFSVAQLAGLTEQEARRYIRYLTAAKLVRRIGTAAGNNKCLYRVAPGAPAPDAAPAITKIRKEKKNGQ